MSAINWDIQKRIQTIITHQSTILLEREEPIHYIWVNRVAQQHILLVGGAGTAKSMLARNTFEHITGGKKFETAFDETSGPEVAFGPPDIKGMIENGVSGWVIKDMFPEAWDAFCDEFFNANGPLLHSLQPALNERIFHNGQEVLEIPLRSMIAGTNQLNAEVSQQALWDRIHQRHVINPLRSRANIITMISQAVERMEKVGRGVRTEIDNDLTKVHVVELDEAHRESLRLPVPDAVIDTFMDLAEALRNDLSVEVSNRRMSEGMFAVKANAWVRGNEVVQLGDLDVLTHMWWNTLDQRLDVRNLILKEVNPSDKAAMEGFDSLAEFRLELDRIGTLDDTKKNHAGTELMKNSHKLLAEAQANIAEAEEHSWPTDKLRRLVERIDDFQVEVGQKLYGL